MGKTEKMVGGGCFQKIKWNAYYYFGKKTEKKKELKKKRLSNMPSDYTKTD